MAQASGKFVRPRIQIFCCVVQNAIAIIVGTPVVLGVFNRHNSVIIVNLIPGNLIEQIGVVDKSALIINVGTGVN